MTKGTTGLKRVPEETKETGRLPVASTRHNNPDLIVWALYLAGGAENWVDVEDLYLKAFELAPARLSWRTRQDIPDYKKCAKALQEVEDSNSPRYLPVFIKNGAYERRLAADGAKWCDLYRERLTALYGGGSVPASPRQVESRRIRELRASALFKQWESGDSIKPSRIQVADLLECSPGSEKKIFDLRLDQALEAARKLDDSATARFVGWLRTSLEESDATT